MTRLDTSLIDDDGWLPIESAPKDGEQVLLCDGMWGPYLGFYEPDRWVFYDRECNEAIWNYWVEGYGPTHWMPLPKPPKDSKE